MLQKSFLLVKTFGKFFSEGFICITQPSNFIIGISIVHEFFQVFWHWFSYKSNGLQSKVCYWVNSFQRADRFDRLGQQDRFAAIHAIKTSSKLCLRNMAIYDFCTDKSSVFLSGPPSEYAYKQGGILSKCSLITSSISAVHCIELLPSLTSDLNLY